MTSSSMDRMAVLQPAAGTLRFLRALLAEELPGVAVLVGKDRRKSGREAIDSLGAQALILDDGLQYWQLARDVDVVLVDAQSPFGNGQVIPAGMLREPVSALKRASVVILTHVCALPAARREALLQNLKALAPSAAMHTADYAPISVETPSGASRPAEALRKRRVMAFCGIGSPESFVGTLTDAGSDVVAELFLRDHAPVTQNDLDTAEDWALASEAEWIVTTAKDYVRMKALRLPQRLRILKAEMVISDFERLLDLVCPPAHQTLSQI